MPTETNLADLPVGTRYRHKHGGTWTVGKRTKDIGAEWSPVAGVGSNLIANIAEILELGTEPQTILINAPTEPEPDIPALVLAYNEAALRLAIARDETVDFAYVDAEGDKTTRWVQPTEIKSVRTGTLLVAKDLDVDEVRNFRLDRIQGEVL